MVISTIRAVEKYDRAHDFVPHKPSGLEGLGSSWKIFLLQEQIHVACIPHCAFVNRSYPCSNSVSTDDRIGNLGLAQGITSTIQTLLYKFHCAKHPLENIDALFAYQIDKFLRVHTPHCTLILVDFLNISNGNNEVVAETQEEFFDLLEDEDNL
jgi:hypothetical protein